MDEPAERRRVADQMVTNIDITIYPPNPRTPISVPKKEERRTPVASSRLSRAEFESGFRNNSTGARKQHGSAARERRRGKKNDVDGSRAIPEGAAAPWLRRAHRTLRDADTGRQAKNTTRRHAGRISDRDDADRDAFREIAHGALISSRLRREATDRDAAERVHFALELAVDDEQPVA